MIMSNIIIVNTYAKYSCKKQETIYLIFTTIL